MTSRTFVAQSHHSEEPRGASRRRGRLEPLHVLTVGCLTAAEEDVTKLLTDREERVGGIQVLSVVATTVPVPLPHWLRASTITAGSESDWDGVVNLNPKGVFLCVRHELRHMVADGGVVII